MNKLELYAEMQRNDLTLDKMAKRLGISSNAFWRKSNGHNDFTLSEIQKIEEVLKLTPDQTRVIFFNQ